VGKYTAEQFIKAVKGTGGTITQIANRVGCDWHTAKRYFAQHPTVQLAWQNERQSITDKARWNVLLAIDKRDLQLSKWWLSVMDDDFIPKQKHEVTGADGAALIPERVDHALAKIYGDNE